MPHYSYATRRFYAILLRSGPCRELFHPFRQHRTGARKMRKITSVAAVRAAEAQGVVTYMQAGNPKEW